MSARLLDERQGAVLVLRISNPGSRNALHPDVYSTGIEIFARASADPQVRAVVLAGDGDHFCAGGNLNRLRENRSNDPALQAASIDLLHRWVLAIRDCPKPVIAAVEGAAAGAGFSLVLACDLVVAALDARFAMSYVRIGLSPDGGSSWFLGSRVPYPLAFEWLATGEPIAAAQLHAAGLVNELVEPGRALEAALGRAAKLARGPAFALAQIKTLLSRDERDALVHRQQRERDAFVAALFHEDAAEGIAAFLAKRRPRFAGSEPP
ncbi:MAG: enoyl-CoA hydratase [Burkholderiaceae bacterium]|nr:enoyl-CoA hydratase [Burkholderiaceae bacterium]